MALVEEDALSLDWVRIRVFQMNDSRDGCLKFKIGWVVWISLLIAAATGLMAGKSYLIS